MDSMREKHPGDGGIPQSLRRAVADVRWTPTRLSALIQGMPKVETHLHLDGSLSPRTIKDLALLRGDKTLAKKPLAEIERLAVVKSPRASLDRVLASFKLFYRLLSDPRAVEEAARRVAQRAASQNVLHFELRFAPALLATEAFPQEDVLEAALRGLRRGAAEFGASSSVIVCLIRDEDLVSDGQNSEMLDLALAYHGRGVVGLDLAGNERARPLSRFKPHFARARKAGLGTTAHAGEAPPGDDLSLILDWELDRIGHGVLAGKHPGLLERIRERDVTIETNPTSNLRTGAVKSLAEHPARSWRRDGIPIAISTDDPGVFGIELGDEYAVLVRHCDFGAEDLLAVSLQGVNSLFLPERRKSPLRRRWEALTLKALRSLAEPS